MPFTPVTPADARDEVAQHVARLFPQVQVTPTDEHGLKVAFHDDRQAGVNTVAAWEAVNGHARDGDWRDHPALAGFAGSLSVLQEPLGTAGLADRLRLVVRGPELVAQVHAAAGEPAPVLTLVEGLYALLVEDRTDTAVLLDPDRFAALGMTPTEAFERAWIHTAALVAARATAHDLPGGAAIYTAGGTFDLSLLLHTPMWQALRASYGEDPVIAAPTHDRLVVVRASDRKGLALLRDLVRQAWHAGGPTRVSDNLYRFDGAAWRVFERKAGSDRPRRRGG